MIACARPVARRRGGVESGAEDSSLLEEEPSIEELEASDSESEESVCDRLFLGRAAAAFAVDRCRWTEAATDATTAGAAVAFKAISAGGAAAAAAARVVLRFGALSISSSSSLIEFCGSKCRCRSSWGEGSSRAEPAAAAGNSSAAESISPWSSTCWPWLLSILGFDSGTGAGSDCVGCATDDSAGSAAGGSAGATGEGAGDGAGAEAGDSSVADGTDSSTDDAAAAAQAAPASVGFGTATAAAPPTAAGRSKHKNSQEKHRNKFAVEPCSADGACG